MAKNLKYLKSTSTKLTVCGLVDKENNSINVDGEDISISTLLTDFNGCETTISFNIKQDEELELNLDGEDEE